MATKKFLEELKVSIPKIYFWGKGFDNAELADKWKNALASLAETGYKDLNIAVSNNTLDNRCIAYAVSLSTSVHIHPMELSVTRVFEVYGSPAYTEGDYTRLAKQSVDYDKTLMLGLAKELATRCGITDEPSVMFAHLSQIAVVAANA